MTTHLYFNFFLLEEAHLYLGVLFIIQEMVKFMIEY